MDQLKPVGFFENPLVGRHVEINLKLIHMALGLLAFSLFGVLKRKAL